MISSGLLEAEKRLDVFLEWHTCPSLTASPGYPTKEMRLGCLYSLRVVFDPLSDESSMVITWELMLEVMAMNGEMI